MTMRSNRDATHLIGRSSFHSFTRALSEIFHQLFPRASFFREDTCANTFREFASVVFAADKADKVRRGVINTSGMLSISK